MIQNDNMEVFQHFYQETQNIITHFPNPDSPKSGCGKISVKICNIDTGFSGNGNNDFFLVFCIVFINLSTLLLSRIGNGLLLHFPGNHA